MLGLRFEAHYCISANTTCNCSPGTQSISLSPSLQLYKFLLFVIPFIRFLLTATCEELAMIDYNWTTIASAGYMFLGDPSLRSRFNTKLCCFVGTVTKKVGSWCENRIVVKQEWLVVVITVQVQTAADC